jgi:hypothetical protein
MFPAGFNLQEFRNDVRLRIRPNSRDTESEFRAEFRGQESGILGAVY